MKNKELTPLQVELANRLSWEIQAGVVEEAKADWKKYATGLQGINRKLKHELATAKATIFSGGVVVFGLFVLFALLLIKGGCQ